MHTLDRTTEPKPAGLKPLSGCEPGTGRQAVLSLGERARPDGQLELDLPIVLAEIPRPRSRARGVRPDPGLGSKQVRVLLAAILEVREGSRAANQLQSALHPRLYQRLLTGSRSRGPRHVLRSVRVSQPVPGVVEACGTAFNGTRALAVAARLEYSTRGWRCTAFELLTPPKSPRKSPQKSPTNSQPKPHLPHQPHRSRR
jgi:hypothetical protein